MFIHTYETKNYGDDWHCAAFTIPKHYLEIQKWCHETFGKPGYPQDVPQTRWRDDIYYGEIYFRDDRDLVLFMLRWA
jgi:hypothetical protein